MTFMTVVILAGNGSDVMVTHGEKKRKKESHIQKIKEWKREQ